MLQDVTRLHLFLLFTLFLSYVRHFLASASPLCQVDGIDQSISCPRTDPTHLGLLRPRQSMSLTLGSDCSGTVTCAGNLTCANLRCGCSSGFTPCGSDNSTCCSVYGRECAVGGGVTCGLIYQCSNLTGTCQCPPATETCFGNTGCCTQLSPTASTATITQLVSAPTPIPSVGDTAASASTPVTGGTGASTGLSNRKCNDSNPCPAPFLCAQGSCQCQGNLSYCASGNLEGCCNRNNATETALGTSEIVTSIIVPLVAGVLGGVFGTAIMGCVLWTLYKRYMHRLHEDKRQSLSLESEVSKSVKPQLSVTSRDPFESDSSTKDVAAAAESDVTVTSTSSSSESTKTTEETRLPHWLFVRLAGPLRRTSDASVPYSGSPLLVETDFNPTASDELALTAGHFVQPTEVFRDGWMLGRNMDTGNVGVLPMWVSNADERDVPHLVRSLYAS
ncbi:hypothetical protein M427DRAFT_313548 [Gonapodya prolifera JEL478]|uniref:Uncharacterized protein n=1 Tax=Gonapodya prolifera (strain JEL478) TaxID=1344416 RepID=A0A139AWS6_GONPJ|nr:hypothetical protein M427DRAFT_313548 [Gonapodya prolifera JEL478]|eukprot:KXS21201.1 hypothetical protein M427DRAFT_313548 [Gonapodya prolifera JEL478]